MSFATHILSGKAEREVRPGEYVDLTVDAAMFHDAFSTFTIAKFDEMGFKSIWEPDRVVIVFDHFVPTSTSHHADIHNAARMFAQKHHVSKVHSADGVCHQLMVEKGYAAPNALVVGTDSHTCTYGALGCFATGIGYTEMASVLGTGRIWLRVPDAMPFFLTGHLQPGVYAKDLILKIIGDIGQSANYRSMEFFGPAVAGLSMSERLTISNMCVEAGAKVGLFPVDNVTAEYCAARGLTVEPWGSDVAPASDGVREYDLSELSPQVACPHTVDNVTGVEAVEGTHIHQAFLGSCTNGRIEDLRIAAQMLAGRKVRSRLIVTPASRSIFQQAVAEGIIETMMLAGAVVVHPSCGLCSGIHGGVIGAGERMIASNNRNFLGRMGDRGSEVFLGSPATVVASAIMGEITDPRRLAIPPGN